MYRDLYSLCTPQKKQKNRHDDGHDGHDDIYLVERLDDRVAGEVGLIQAELLRERLPPGDHHPLRQHGL